MSKITADHLCRPAYVYVRQSTMKQVHHNLESQRRQYGLVERATQLGWKEVITIDEDLGRTGTGMVARPGFDRLLRAVGKGDVGAVFAIEASRLARNGRDWHTLLDFCIVVGTLIIDEDGVYDPRLSNDQMLLGLKGAFSVMESSAIRQRACEVQAEMAERGELYSMLPPGYVVDAAGRLVKDPDRRVQEALGLVFSKFRELGSARKVTLWFRQEEIRLPLRSNNLPGRAVVWKLPTYDTILRTVAHPIYAGAYVWGRRGRRTQLEDGHRRVRYNRQRSPEDWRVLLRDHHEGYINWDEFEHNQRLLANNATGKGSAVQGAIRRGPALLAGLLRCARCGRKLAVRYVGNQQTPAYACSPRVGSDEPLCSVSFGAQRVDRAVSAEVLGILRPLGIEAALAAVNSGEDRNRDQRRQAELALEAARYEAALARRQYDAVDPDNRLVAGELERRWNERLVEAQRLETQMASLVEDPGNRLDPGERERLLELGCHLPEAWNHPAASVEIKKRILRTIIREIVVNLEDDRLHLLIHWQGGDHTALDVARRIRGRWRDPNALETEEQTAAMIGALARIIRDSSIAHFLNRRGVRTISGLTWNADRIEVMRSKHGITAYREGERAERGELMLDDVMRKLGVAKMTVIRMIRAGRLAAKQVCPGGPYVIRHEDLDLVIASRTRAPEPVSADTQQLSIDFQ